MTGDSTSGSSRGANYLDVDAAFLEDEYQRSPIVVTAFGRDWSFPGVMPAIVPVRLARWDAEGKDIAKLGAAETFLLLGDLIPVETLEAWSKLGVDVLTPEPKVERIIEHLVRIYFERQGDITGTGDGSAGEAPAPRTGPADSSDTGASSKPTSDASTTSPSPALSGG